jgi:hypothetical protein
MWSKYLYREIIQVFTPAATSYSCYIRIVLNGLRISGLSLLHQHSYNSRLSEKKKKQLQVQYSTVIVLTRLSVVGASTFSCIKLYYCSNNIT